MPAHLLLAALAGAAEPNVVPVSVEIPELALTHRVRDAIEAAAMAKLSTELPQLVFLDQSSARDLRTAGTEARHLVTGGTCRAPLSATDAVSAVHGSAGQLALRGQCAGDRCLLSAHIQGPGDDNLYFSAPVHHPLERASWIDAAGRLERSSSPPLDARVAPAEHLAPAGTLGIVELTTRGEWRSQLTLDDLPLQSLQTCRRDLPGLWWVDLELDGEGAVMHCELEREDVAPAADWRTCTCDILRELTFPAGPDPRGLSLQLYHGHVPSSVEVRWMALKTSRPYPHRAALRGLSPAIARCADGVITGPLEADFTARIEPDGSLFKTGITWPADTPAELAQCVSAALQTGMPCALDDKRVVLKGKLTLAPIGANR